RDHARGQGLHPGTAGVAQWAAQHRVPRACGARGGGPAVGDLGWVAHPRPGRGEPVAWYRLLVIWDGSPIHRRVEVTEFVSQTRGKGWLEALPGYAPDLNPWDEGGWQHLKHVELRNLVCGDLEELPQEFYLAVARMQQKPVLVQSFFAQAGLSI